VFEGVSRCVTVVPYAGMWDLEHAIHVQMVDVDYSVTTHATVDGDEGCGVRAGEQMTYCPYSKASNSILPEDFRNRLAMQIVPRSTAITAAQLPQSPHW